MLLCLKDGHAEQTNKEAHRVSEKCLIHQLPQMLDPAFLAAVQMHAHQYAMQLASSSLVFFFRVHVHLGAVGGVHAISVHSIR